MAQSEPLDRVALDAVLRACDPRLRLATEHDAAAVSSLLAELAAAEWERVPPAMAANLAAWLADPGQSFCIVGGEPPDGLAIVQVMPAPAEGGVQLCLDDVTVRPAARGRGLGEALVRGVVSAGRALDACYLYLHVRPGNQPARRLYERVGLRAAPDVVYELSLDASPYREEG